MELQLVRDEVHEHMTIGRLFVNSVWKWWTLEGKPCIPAGRYKIALTVSTRYKQFLPLLLNVPGFTGVLIHPGHASVDTSGCILVGGGYDTTHLALLHTKLACDKLQTGIQKALNEGESVSIMIFDPEKK